MTVHLVKLCVGADTVEELAAWQRWQIASGRRLPVCGTRSWPKRNADLLNGGSLYWVIKGQILVRQRIREIAEVEDEHGLRCGFWLAPELVRTRPTPKRPFQGWRYLEEQDAPPDLDTSGDGGTLPEALQRELAALGAW